jgi:hypothetical protein
MLYQTWGSWGFEQLRIGIYVSEWGLYLKLFQYTESWLEQKILKWGGWGFEQPKTRTYSRLLLCC